MAFDVKQYNFLPAKVPIAFPSALLDFQFKRLYRKKSIIRTISYSYKFLTKVLAAFPII